MLGEPGKLGSSYPATFAESDGTRNRAHCVVWERRNSMKCIQLFNNVNGDTIRVSDAEAANYVSKGTAKYMSKRQWKTDGRKYK